MSVAQDSEVRFVQIDDVAPLEVVAQMHGERRVGVHLRMLDSSPERFIAHTRYDPGLILARHAHSSDFTVYVIEGEVEIGGQRCPAGTLVMVAKDAFFGPLIVGPEGCTILESYSGNVASVHEDEAAYQAMLEARGIVPVVNPGAVRP